MRKSRSLLGAILVMVAVLLAACGGTADSDAGSSNGTGGSSVPKATVGWVDATLAGSFQQRLYQVAEAGFDHLGWDLKTVDTKGDPAAAAAGVSSLVDSGVDAIFMSGVTPSTARAGLIKAQSKEIPVVLVGSEVDPSLNEDLGLTYFGQSETDLFTALADYLLESEIEPGDEVGILMTSFLLSGQLRSDALVKDFEEAGVKVVGTLDTGFDFAAGEKNASTLLTQHPNLKAIIPVYDLWTAASVSAVKRAGRQGKVKVYSAYADAVNTPLMRDNPDTVAAVADGNMVITPLIAIDQVLHHLADGKDIDPTAADGKLTYQVITPENLPPGDQNGPVSIDEATAPFFAQWDSEFGASS